MAACCTIVAVVKSYMLLTQWQTSTLVVVDVDFVSVVGGGVGVIGVYFVAVAVASSMNFKLLSLEVDWVRDDCILDIPACV